MPRSLALQELSDLLGVLSHPDRVRIVEELRGGELDVNHLADAIELRHARVSQHLALLRAQRVVEKRRDGRHVYYHLTQPRIAAWLIEGLDFLETRLRESDEVRSSVLKAKERYSN
jgi:DNA-binding transcriptional ArsR family regulator